MENSELERENSGDSPIKQLQGESITDQNAMDRTPEPSSSDATVGITFPGPDNDALASTVIQSGGKTTLNANANSPSTSIVCQERIEFNVQECVPSFFGRDEFITKMHEYIWHIQTENNEEKSLLSQAIVIYGQEGVGKTEVVRKYIQRYKSSYDNVLWINADSFAGATRKLLQLAGDTPLGVNQNVKQKPDEIIIEDIYDFVCRKFSLLVFDNVGSFKTDDGKDDLYRFLPKAVKTGWKVPSIIVTTRNRLSVDFKIDELPAFDSSESLSFLSSLEFRDCEDNRTLLQEVVQIYQGLPLALQQVVTFVRNKREDRNTLDDEPYTLQDFLTGIASKREGNVENKPEREVYPDVYRLFDMTFEYIGSMKHGQLALQCLDVMAILKPDNIPTELIKTIFSYAEDNLAIALNLLHKFNLIIRYGDYYQMHRIIQAAKMESSNLERSKLDYVKQNFEQIVDSIQEIVQNLSTDSENVHEMLYNIVRIHENGSEIVTKQFLKFKIILANKLIDVGSYKTGVQIYRTALQSSEKLYGVAEIETIDTKEKLAIALLRQGINAEAEILLNDVMKMRAKLQGPDDLDALATKNNLAFVLVNQGKFEQARKLYKNILQIQSKILGPNLKNTLTIKNNLATVLQKQGKFEEAEKLINEILQMQIKISGSEHPDTLTTKTNLATVMKAQGKLVEVRELYKDVLQLQTTILGPTHSDTIKTKNNLAFVLNAQKDFEQAREIYNDVLQMVNKIFGPNHPNTLTAKNNLAFVLDNQGKFEEARELYNDVLQMRITILGPNHPNTLNSKNNLAAVLNAQGKFEDALELYNDILQIQNRLFGMDDPSTLNTKNNLAAVFHQQGKIEKALELYNDVLKMRNKILGPDHPNTLVSKNNLAVVFQDQGNFKKAQKLYKEILQSHSKILGLNHPKTLNTKINLANVFQEHGKFKEASKHYYDVWKFQNEIFGSNHPITLSTKSKYDAAVSKKPEK